MPPIEASAKTAVQARRSRARTRIRPTSRAGRPGRRRPRASSELGRRPPQAAPPPTSSTTRSRPSRGLGEAARAKQDGDEAKAAGLQQQAMKDLPRLLRPATGRTVTAVSAAIRKHLRDFIAIAAAAGRRRSASAYVIVQNQRLRIPVLEEKPFELKAEFQTAQAVVPGQGQTLRVAGRQGRRRRGGRARERRGGRHLRGRPRLPADLQGRDDPAAPADRPQGHVLRDGPRDASGRRDRGGRHGPARQHRARRQPRRDPRRARLRHPGLPAAAARRRRAGPRRPRQGPRPGARLARAAHQGPRRRSTRRSPSARTTCAA